MDIFSAIKDEKSKKNMEALMNGETINNAKPIKKKTNKVEKKEKTKKEKQFNVKHFEEYHFTNGKELLEHIKSGKKAYRGGELGWITIDNKDRNMVVSYQKQEATGKMGFSYESVDTFKSYIEILDNTKVNGYIDFWHKKPFEKKVKNNSEVVENQ